MGHYFSTPPPPKPEIDIFTLVIYFYLGVIILKKLEDFKTPRGKRKSENLSLDDVVGLESVKEEIHHYMDFIKNRDKYKEWDVKVPKGILLAGPPGTGKTLLVKAIADSLDIPIISASGSEFVEMYVGVGASRVRKLFNKARSHDGCIIFIDEIDAVGSRRDADNNSERASTLNQLLTEMDGFDSDSNIMIFAATNLVSRLDPALVRSGRFDKKIYFDLPNVEERMEIFKLNMQNSEIGYIDYQELADRSTGLSGADIANVANQAKINAINRNQDSITDEDIQKALDEVMIGREKRERMLSPEERKRVAHHEAGHAIMGYLLEHAASPLKVSIIPRGEAALGFSQNKPDPSLLHTDEYILSQIAVLLGGRSAEYIIYGNLSTGASDDIEKITRLAESYHTRWGMSEQFGPFNPHSIKLEDDNVSTHCQGLISDLEDFTLRILNENTKYIKKLAKKLLESETLSYQIVRKTIGKKRENSINIDI